MCLFNASTICGTIYTDVEEYAICVFNISIIYSKDRSCPRSKSWWNCSQVNSLLKYLYFSFPPRSSSLFFDLSPSHPKWFTSRYLVVFINDWRFLQNKSVALDLALIVESIICSQPLLLIEVKYHLKMLRKIRIRWDQ